MKTRILQDEPEPSSADKGVDLASAQMQRAMNIAGRMGNWSASHWKTAVFGWLAAVLVLAYAGNALVGLKLVKTDDIGVGRVHGPQRRPGVRQQRLTQGSRADAPGFPG